jgi:DNA ligase-1
MARTVIDILEELESTSGKLAKIDIMEAARKNDLLKRVFVAAQDPYTVYYVSKFKMPKALSATWATAPIGWKNGMADDLLIEKFLDFLGPLSRRETTGNAAKDAVQRRFAVMTELQQKWCQRILLKNLRAGVQESVNKVWPNLIKGFEVALAKTLNSSFTRGEGIKILDKVNYPVRVEPKLDGLRCIAVKKDGVVTFYTRNGTVLESMPKIKAVLEGAKYDNVVLDGEGMAADWNESASVMMSKTQKDDSNLYYNVFDAMPLNEWVAQEGKTLYRDRVKLVHEVVLACVSFDNEPARVRQVPHINAKNEEELKAFFSKCMSDGYEGVMLKTLDTPYVWDRSKNILKLKPCVTYEGVIVGSYLGRKNTKREGQFGGFYVLLPNQVITRVGGGFNDALRAQIQQDDPDSWNGKVAECEAQPDPLTKDGLTVDGKMRFPVYCRIRPAGDVDKSITATYKWWKGLSAAERQERLDAVTRDKNED